MTLTRRFLLTGLAAAASLTALPVLAGPGNGFNNYVYIPDFNAADKARIAKATAYLQSLSTAQGRFQQTDLRGHITNGDWFLERPGKIRFAYDAPSSVLIVSDGTTISNWNPRLQAFNQYPLSETPLSLFLSRQISFGQGVVITEVTSNATGFHLKARDRRQQVEGFVVLGFDQAANGAVTLRDWTIVDAQNRPTTVKLTSLNAGGHLSPDLFVLKKPAANK